MERRLPTRPHPSLQETPEGQPQTMESCRRSGRLERVGLSGTDAQTEEAFARHHPFAAYTRDGQPRDSRDDSGEPGGGGAVFLSTSARWVRDRVRLEPSDDMRAGRARGVGVLLGGTCEWFLLLYRSCPGEGEYHA